jgi:DNA-binding response OmpR family regulator
MATILIADDDPDVTHLVRKAVVDAGHEAVVVDDGTRALARAATADLVVLDVSMPGLDGHEVTAALREAAHTQHLPVLVLSSMSTADDVGTALDAGADDYLTKPVVQFEVARRVERLLATDAIERRTARYWSARRRGLRTA